MIKRWNVVILGMCAGLAWTSASRAQDSVSNTPCLPGDAVSPWATGEQCNNYVVDLEPFTTSWGTTFGIAPLLKTSKSTTAANPTQEFFSSLTSSQALSRTQRSNVTLSGMYDLWSASGFGINDDTNTPPSMQANLNGLKGNQFALALAEFATTDQTQSYNAVIGGVVNYIPSDPTRLYVKRVMAAVNSPNDAANVSQFGLGSIDADGNLMIRADGSGTAGCGMPTCTPALNGLLENNIFKIKLASRSCGALNVISQDYPGGSFDMSATEWLVRNQPATGVTTCVGGPNCGMTCTVNADCTPGTCSGTGLNYDTPGVVPASTAGGTPLMIDTNFSSCYVRGTAFGSITSDGSQYPTAPVEPADGRGNLSWVPGACTALGSPTRGVVGFINEDGAAAANTADTLIVWGLDNSGNVTGKRALTLPAVVTDNQSGATNLAGTNEFDHYHSQVAFRGGNGQVGLGIDQNGNLLAAAVVNQPNDAATRDWPLNYIAVAKMTCSGGALSWTMAGYWDGTNGKPIYSGAGGTTQIGTMTGLANVTGGTPQGPSMSSPMIDSVGNIWFLAAIDLPAEVDRYDTALLRAVYDPAAFSYKLELVLRTGDIFHGANSNLNYQIRFLEIADSNSVSSGGAWSQNVSAVGHTNASVAGLMPVDPRTLGGLVLAAGIAYDVAGDGIGTAAMSDDCIGGVTADPDNQEYNVLLYIGATDPGAAVCGNGLTESGEQCDDGNTMAGDGCSATCQMEAAGCPCTTDADCRSPGCADDNACNCGACVTGTCQFTCEKFGNVNCDGGQLVNLDDILYVLGGFANFPMYPNADINPCGGNGIVNLDDILSALSAFSGMNLCGCQQAGVAPLCGSSQP